MEDELSEYIALATFFFLFGGVVVVVARFMGNTLHGIIYTIVSGNPFRYVDLFPRRIAPFQERFLLTHFEFYRALPPRSRSIFNNRLAKFMASKKFETRQGLQLTDEMKLSVSFSAIQLTLGLSDYKFRYFGTIILYPAPYFSKISRNYHKGEVNNRGVIVFSWPDFKAGYDNPADNLNLGLHEFAHALFINYFKNRNDCIHFEYHYEDWRRIGDKEFFRMRSQDEHYLRSYAATNQMEFFAVCVEHFFERPAEFKSELPELYRILSRFLAQDPSRLQLSDARSETGQPAMAM